MNKFTIIQSTEKYKAAPAVDQEITISLENSTKQSTEFDRSETINLQDVYNNERQKYQIFRPTFTVDYLYDNTITGTTTYIPFRDNLYYVDAIESKADNVWKGFPQYYEFDFFRPDVKDQHFTYTAKSAYTYNWMYYLTYPHKNNPNKSLFYTSPTFGTINWIANDGIPFSITRLIFNGSSIIQFKCIAPHGLTSGEYAELSFKYNQDNLFPVYSLGNGSYGSDEYIFNVFDIGYTGNTFINGRTGTFRRVINPDNRVETTSEYYIRVHKTITTVDDLTVTKNAFQKNNFSEKRQLEIASITPNNITRISKKNNSNSYNFTCARDININGLLDNQKRPITELFLTIINRGYSGYFNEPTPNTTQGLKEGWGFNLSTVNNPWWDLTNVYSNAGIETGSYTLTSGVTKTFFYNKDLALGSEIDGDFCEWNDYTQTERVISPYYQKIKFNEKVFQTVVGNNPLATNTNGLGYYYKPHYPMTIRVFSDYIETNGSDNIDNLPNYAYYSNSDREFRWRDIYTYGFIDNLGRGVNYPFLNGAHYPYQNSIFRLIPDGSNLGQTSFDAVTKPLIDDCE
jgi:hypothetical protein